MIPRAAAVAGLFAGLVAFSGEPEARAQSQASGEIRRSKLVQVYVAGSAETVARTRVAVQELVARLDLPTVVRDAAGADEELLNGERSAAMVNAYVDLRSLEAPRVIVADGASGAVLERRTLPAASSTETAVEAAAHVLYMTVESVLRTQEPAPPKPEPKRVEEPPKPAPEPEPVAATASPVEDEPPSGADASGGNRAGWGANAGIFGAVASFGPSLALAGGGVTMEASPRALTVRPGLRAVFTLYAPGEVTGQGATGSLQSTGVRLVPFVEWAAAEFLAVQLGAGFGADFLRFDPEQPPPGATSLGTLETTDLVITSDLGAKLRISESVSLLAGFAVDVDTSPRRYVAQYGGARESVFELGRVRPQGFLGFGFSFAGRPQFARGER